MFVAMGWMLLAGLRLTSPPTIDSVSHAARAPAGRVAVWTDRDDPYRRGEGARVFLRSERATYATVLRLDTDGRLRVLFPREPWGDTRVPDARDFEVSGGRGGRSFIVDDYPGIGYLLAIASSHSFDFDDIARGDHWDYRLMAGGRVEGDPYVALADLAARIAPGGDYDYDISPYYVDRRYDYPRFLCYDCHAYAKYDEWDPYRQACARFRVVIYDDPRFYPYRSGRGRNIVMARPVRPGPRFVFRDADPKRDYVTRVRGGEAVEQRRDQDPGRTSRDIGGRGSVPAPAMSSARATPRMAPPLRAVPSRPPLGDGRPEGRRRSDLEPAERKPADATPPHAPPKGLEPTRGETRPPASKAEPQREPPRAAEPQREPRRTAEPRSTGEPELRRRKP